MDYAVGQRVEHQQPGGLPRVGTYIRSEGRQAVVRFPMATELVYRIHLTPVPTPQEIADAKLRIRSAHGHLAAEDA